ncbi:uncharacterized protein [Henckelia pumila]|uniref:uncharacterized protein n=1 Tax=Henckelia pumila TaxID=405737 RepID=UPI003C6E4518
MAANANLSLRQLGTPDLNQQSLCITYPTLEANVTFELKSGLIHLLPSFHGLAGLLPHDRIMLDAASGRVFVDKTPQAARNLIENTFANSQQFGTNRSDHTPRRNNEVNVSSLEQQLIELTSRVRQMAVGNGQTAKACGICAKVGHATDMCPTLQEKSVEQVKATGGFPGWKDHPNLRYGNPPVNQPTPHVQPNNQAYRPPYHPPPQRPQISAPGEFLENIVKDLPTNMLNFQQETRASIQNLNTQVGHLATAVNRLEAQHSNGLLSQTVLNPKENVSAITLRSGREMKGCQKVESGEQISAVIQRKIPTKCKDPGMFSIPCKIGDVQLDTAMLDLRASINVMSYSVYGSLKLRPLNETTTVIQMTDRSTIYPMGVIEDVLMQVGNLVFFADFYVLDMQNNDLKSPILLGRPFLKTSNSIIDVNNGTLTMKFDGKIVKFNIFDTLKIHSCETIVNTLDVINHLPQKNKEFLNGDKLEKVVAKYAKNSNDKIFPSDLQAPRIEQNLPPDRDTEIPMKSKEKQHGLKLTAKTLKWVKNRVPPHPQSKFQYDSCVIPSDIEEDDNTNT